jgi:HEAT repeat protein
MSFRTLPFLLAAGLGLLVCVPAPSAPNADQLREDELAVRSASIGTDGASLIAFLRSRMRNDADPKRIASLIEKLGSDDFVERDQATDDLVAVGVQASDQLKKATKSDDVEVVRRAEDCLGRIEKVAGSAVTCSVARLLASKKPAGAAKALLAFAPLSDDDGVLDEVRAAVTTLAFVGGKPDPDVLAALKVEKKDARTALRRAIAAEALVRSGDAKQRKDMRQFLKDEDKQVRLRVGLALVDVKDKTAIPALINLMGDLTSEQSWPVEEILYSLAGEEAPDVALGADANSKKKFRQAWQKWWDKNEKKVDLAKVRDPRKLLGYTLIVEQDFRKGARQNGVVYELDDKGKERWKIDGLQWAYDARVVGKEHVVIAEYQSRQVTKRTFKNEVKWTKSFSNWPLEVQPLINGNILVTFTNSIVEIDKDGKDVKTYSVNVFNIVSAHKLRNGRIVYATQNGVIGFLDATGKQVSSFNTGQYIYQGGHIDVMSNGNVLVPVYAQSKVFEYDRQGKLVKQIQSTYPTSVQRLPNGNTLTASMYNQSVVEVDKNGKQIWTHRPNGRVYQAYRR